MHMTPLPTQMQGSSKVKHKSPSTTANGNAPFLLKSYGHQVSGRAGILCYNNNTLCKPYVSRELFFYYFLPAVLQKFTPEFRGLVNVTFIENVHTGCLLTYAQPKSLILPHTQVIKTLVENPRPHSKRCVKDYGRTHVIYPTSPLLLTLRSKTEADSSSVKATEDDVENLTRGFDQNVNLNNEDASVMNNQGGSTGLRNPWNSKVLDDAWIRLKADHSEFVSSGRHMTTSKTKRFVLLEDVTSPYQHPCVLDLKMGTRVREHASAAKLARHVTAIDIGARLSGMQIYHPLQNEFEYVNKYCGHNLTVEGFKVNLARFFSRHTDSREDNSEGDTSKEPSSPASQTTSNVDKSLINCAVTKLRSLREALATLDSHRFYSCSLLIIYEGNEGTSPDRPKQTLTDVQSDNLRKQDETKTWPKPNHHSLPLNYKSDRQKRLSRRPKSLPNFAESNGRKSEDSSPDISATISNLTSNICKLPSLKGNTNLKLIRDSDFKSFGHGIMSSLKDISLNSSEKRHSPPTKASSKRRRRINSCGSLNEKYLTSCRSQNTDYDVVGIKGFSDCVDVRLIDFAHYCCQDQEVHPGPDGGFLFGLDNLITLLENMIAK